MLVLALDTTASEGSCALARDGDVLQQDISEGRHPPASRLPGDLMRLLDSCGVSVRDIDVFAVVTGPGSFTGLRVGIATMQGLALAAHKPLIGVSGLDALAFAAAHPGRPGPSSRTATWVDAWRGDIYAALYEDGKELAGPVVARPHDVLAAVAALEPRPTLFIGSGAASFRHLILSTLGDYVRVADQAPPLAAQAARIATRLARTGVRPPPDAIRPLYVLRPDSGLARSARA